MSITAHLLRTNQDESNGDELPSVKSLENILAAVEGVREVRGRRDRAIGAIRYDSRRVAPGDLYVAINGRDDHGVEFIDSAMEAGATTLVVDDAEHISEEIAAEDMTIVIVEDARRAMAQMAAALNDFASRRLRILGITGTNGKTTTAWVLRQILEPSERVAVIGTLGVILDEIIPTGYTTPEAPELEELLKRIDEEGYDTVAMEVSSHALALERVSGLVFSGGVFTNLTQDHLDFHQSMNEYRDAKKLLFDRLDADRPAVVNIDDPHGATMVRDSYARVYRYGSALGADARISDVRLGAGGSDWKLILADTLGGGELALCSPLVGAFNISNVTAAVTLALALGVKRSDVATRVETLRPVPGRMESIDLGGGSSAIVDYAHTPDALGNVLESCRKIAAPDATLTVVFGCGGDRDRAKRPIMGEIASRLADCVIVTSDNPRSEDPDAIIAEILSGIAPGTEATAITDRADAIRAALEKVTPGDMVLVAGKGHETYQITGEERRHFDDREIVREWVMENGGVALA